MAPSTLLAGILTFAWPFATTKPSLIAVAIIYGLVFHHDIDFISLIFMHQELGLEHMLACLRRQ